jgi:hypothetical protein
MAASGRALALEFMSNTPASVTSAVAAVTVAATELVTRAARR